MKDVFHSLYEKKVRDICSWYPIITSTNFLRVKMGYSNSHMLTWNYTFLGGWWDCFNGGIIWELIKTQYFGAYLFSVKLSILAYYTASKLVKKKNINKTSRLYYSHNKYPWNHNKLQKMLYKVWSKYTNTPFLNSFWAPSKIFRGLFAHVFQCKESKNFIYFKKKENIYLLHIYLYLH